MFDDLTMEIIYYSMIPAFVVALIILLLIIFGRKKKDFYKYNYIINVSLIVMISLVLPFVTGYTIWLVGRYLNKGVLLSNLGFVIILSILIIFLITLLVIVCRRLYKSFDKLHKEKKA